MVKRINPCRPRLVIISAGFDDEKPVPRCYAAPNDGRPLEDLTLGELRPWPAMDARLLLARVMGQVVTPPASAPHTD